MLKFNKITYNENEKKRKIFLVNFFSYAALFSLSAFAIYRLIEGKVNYSYNLFIFLAIVLLNLILLKFYKNINIAAHVIIILMFIFGIIVFSFLGVGISGLFWFYTFPALTISLTNYKTGSLYSALFILTTIIIYKLNFNFVTNVYPDEVKVRFISSYFILNILIVIFEYSRETAQKKLTKTVEKLKETNEELIASEEELRTSSEDVYVKNEQLIEQEKRLYLAQKAGGIGIWEWETEKDILIWSDIVYEILGIRKSNKNLTSNDFFKIIHADDKDRLIKELDTTLKNKATIKKTEYRILKNNEIKHIEETSELIKNKQGRLIKMIGVLQDITERKKTEIEIKEKNEELTILTEELKQSNEELLTLKEDIEKQNILLQNTLKKYNLISNSISDLIWMLSFDFKPLYISPSCKKFIGYNIEEMKTLSLEEFHSEASLKKIVKLIDDTKELRDKPEKAKGVKTEIEYIHKDGHIIIAEVSAFLIYDDNKKAIAIGGISRDITKRKKTEAELAESNKKIVTAHKDILDNIKYARTIQNGLLTKKEFIDGLLGDYFLIFKQRFDVGGDFYYINRIKDYIILAVGDCTGHGIPGGFLSMLAITYLHETIKIETIKTTGLTLDIIRKRFKRIFKDENDSGFNISLCAINKKTNVLQFSGAYHPLVLIRDNEIIEYKATKNPIGDFFIEENFKTQEIKLKNKDKIYLFSDGYYDQINPEGKKIGKKTLKSLLLKNSNLPFIEQKKQLFYFLKTWQQNQNQIDDITVLGVNWKI